MRNYSKPKFLFTEHAVKRIVKRRVPISSISLVAQVGITIQSTNDRVMKRGDVNGQQIHVVIEKPSTIISVYFADQWSSTIDVTRHKPQRLKRTFA
ncbi:MULTISPECIES: DUF4258 domain-containing protein [Alicyclobacillus]|uniref:DUF4258 domain-containing protein n=1 Tax=Alicyclobacillus acidoterrestris (strain ATCC 49025 / DSM 3922 / CIP 106132 / NCIMB 13137 / GD3B) TaxID=1356854 RepID=T0C5R5_ALIAG|nr:MULTISPECIES: DUF4258 domain-containing protein [Alicyclobacillus]EPZ47885.1 hypothetical protein N007_04815 [Alicyclobacillus acidoterrestris ATCC 49025]UNO51048.1 DUF4258 domain-containing protein [Alicyclobacillus acidoterrestris]GEO28018.1 hypothetical protein AAC03nite_38030 [Alicyclobacillus acidoterrestris]